MPPPALRDRLTSYLPFAVVAVVGQLSAAWRPGPTDPGLYLVSSLILFVILALLVVRRGMPPRTFVVGSALYMSSVALLMLTSGGMDSGLGVLLFMPVVGIALYGKRWESVVSVVFILSAILAVTLASTSQSGATTLRRLLLTAAISAMLSVSIHVLRSRLIESNAHTERMLRHEEAINAAAHQLVQLSEPPQITALGVRIATGIASPSGSEEIVQAWYFRIEDGMVVNDSPCDEFGTVIEGRWPLREHPGLREAVETLQPVVAPFDGDTGDTCDTGGSSVRALLRASGATCGAWVPVVPDGELHGVLGIASRGAAIPSECVERCVALGHFLELALSNWAAHRTLEQQATLEERRRIARELHDGLAHELAFIASKTRGAAADAATSREARELAGAADRALDEARRAITVLSVTQPQSLDDAISQTVEDLGSRLGVVCDLQLADDVHVPGEVTENLLRIVREAITNAANHGASEHVRVSLERSGQLRLVIEDDGCGFDPDRHADAGGFGLQSMQERAASVGAVLSVDSVPEQGTRDAVAFRSNSPITVLLADDHARTRALVRNALEGTGDFRICVEAADAVGAIEGAKRERPDVCLLDINMPGNGIAAATQITGALPETSVVMLTVSRQDEDLFDALRAGASGYLLKGLDEATIGDALQRVLAGEATLPGTLVARLVDEFRDREHRRVAVPEGQAARLTGREWDVLELMRKGAGTAEISERLFVSPTTVRTHVSSILRKLGVPTREAAVRLLDGQAGAERFLRPMGATPR